MSDFDAIVIGTGFGGAVAACRLVQHKNDICVLERGRRYESQPPAEVEDGERPWSDFPDLPRKDDALPDPKRWAWGDEQGLWDLRNLDGIVAVQAAGYGGGSLIYANVHLRAPKEVFEGWPFTREELEPYYELAAYMLNAKPITARVPAPPEKTQQFQKAADGLGRGQQFFYPPLAVNFDGSNAFGRSQRACNDCGECITGCRYRAKNTLDFNYLAIVDDSPKADVRTQAEAVSITARAGGGYEVEYRDHLLGGKSCFVSAKWVFVCAGAVNSTELLLRSKVAQGLPNLNGDLLGCHFYPNADFPAIVYDARTPEQEPRLLGQTKGPTITASLYHEAPTAEPDEPSEEPKPWCLVQEGGFPVEMARHMGVFRAPVLLRRNRHDDRTLREGEIRVVEGQVSPRDPVALPDGDPPLLRSLIDGLYALLENDSQILHKIAHKELREAVAELEGEFQRFQDAHLKAVLEQVREKIRSRWYLRLVPDCLIPSAESMLGDTKQVLRERYSLGDTGSEHVELATRLGSWLLEFNDARGAHSQNSLILLGMGPDSLGGKIELVENDLQVKMEEGWDAALPETEALMRDVACALGGKLRVNPLWSFARRQVTVHSQGGCPMSDDPTQGVTDPAGQVYGHPGLFVMDAAAFPASIGVNPSATIAAVAERNMAQLLREPADKQAATDWWADQAWTGREGVALEPRREGGGVKTVNHPIGIEFKETMSGFHWADPVPEKDEDPAFRAAEVRGRQHGSPLSIELTARIEDVAAFIHSKAHAVDVAGEASLVWDAAGVKQKSKFQVSGRLTLFGSPVEAEQRKMQYDLDFAGPDIVLTGYKRIRNDAGADAWRDTSRLLTTLISPGGARSYGVIHVPLDRFLFEQLPSFRVLHTNDPARIAWALSSFGAYFFGHLQRIYLPQLGKVIESFADLDLR